MIALLLALTTAAFATAPEIELQTVAQVRHDLFGDRLVPAMQYVQLGQRVGRTRFDADAALTWLAGVDHPTGLDIYTLQARGQAAWGTWTAGRQHALTAHRRQTFDGGRVTFDLAKGMSLEAWGGVARHHDLDDLLDGIGMGRVALRYAGHGLALRVGAEVEGWTDSDLVARQDLEVRYQAARLGSMPFVLGRVVAAEPEGGGIEWARLEVGLRPVARVQTTLHAQHRAVVDTGSLFGDAIVQAITGGAIDEFGGGIRVDGTKLTALSARYSFSTFEREVGPQFGHSVNVEYLHGSRGVPIRVFPAYAFRTGPGGTYHAAYTRVIYALDDQTEVRLRGALVPFRKAHADWDLAVDGMVEVERELSQVVRVGINADAASDRLHHFDVRVGGFLTVEAR